MSQPPPPAESRPAPPKRRLVDASYIFIVLFALSGGIACYAVRGPDVFWAAIDGDIRLFLTIVPVVAGAILLAAFAQVLIPAALVRSWLGRDSGLRGIVTGTALGTIMPGGPMASFPLMLAVLGAGADYAVAVALLNSWALLGMHRVLVWELPLMGSEFALIRVLATLPLPILTGWLAAMLFARLRPPGAR